MSRADIALYEAKRTRLSAVAYHPGLQPAGETTADDRPSHEQRALAAALARAVDAKDAGTRSHSETVAQLCAAIGERVGIGPSSSSGFVSQASCTTSARSGSPTRSSSSPMHLRPTSTPR